MSSTETSTFTLPSGGAAKLKTYLTGREKRALRGIFLKDVEVSTDAASGKPTTSGIKGTAIEEGENFIINTIVVELNGSAENILERVLDLPATDYDALLAQLNSITEDKEKKA